MCTCIRSWKNNFVQDACTYMYSTLVEEGPHPSPEKPFQINEYI